MGNQEQLLKVSIVPNTALDKRGFANRIFHTLVPVLNKSKELKKTNYALYKLLKYTTNTLLLFLLLGVVWSVVNFITVVFS